MADYIRYANTGPGTVRSQPLSPELIQALSFLPELGLTFEVFSGGQPKKGTSTARVGEERHDDGHAADGFFYRDGERLSWENPAHMPLFERLVQRGRETGLTSFGAGPGYMQPGSMHLGVSGAPAVWGAGGKGANAPDWLRKAYGLPPGNNAFAGGQTTPSGGPYGPRQMPRDQTANNALDMMTPADFGFRNQTFELPMMDLTRNAFA